ncbi:MAG: DNA polymerase, partial [Candidatus Acidiferrales bacterium]
MALVFRLGLAPELGIDQREAAKFIAKYFERYNGVKNFLDRQIAETRRTGVNQDTLRTRSPNPGNQFAATQLAQFRRAHGNESPMQGAAADLPIEQFCQDRHTAVLLLIMSVTLAPLLEETVFRGY